VIRRLAIGIVVVATACGTSADPSPTPTNPPTTTSSSGTSSVAPRPTVPPTASRALDVSKFASHTCDSLTSQQLVSLGVSDFKRQDATTTCSWSQGETTFDIALYPDKNTLVRPYEEANNRNRAAVFEPFEIRGFPAVKRQMFPNGTHTSDCNVSVALGPNSGIHIAGFSQESGVDWCAKSVAAAEFIIQNLGG
jgi:hypothetical protein